MVFDWDVSADRIYVSPEAEQSLGLKRGSLEGAAASWLEALHPFDRDRYSTCLDTVLEQRRGRINLDFRLRAADGHYLWYFLKARPVVGADGEVIRVVGTLADVTESRTAEERMLHDAVRDNLTGLPEPGDLLRPARHSAGSGAQQSRRTPHRHRHRHRPLPAGQ